MQDLKRILALGVIDCGSLEGALERAHRIPLFAWDHDDSAASWHLEDVVAMVGHRHELGDRKSVV